MTREGDHVIGVKGHARPSASDADRLLRFVSDAEDLGRDDPFPAPVLEQLGELIGAGWIGYIERDLVGWRCLVAFEHPDLPGIEFDPDTAHCLCEEDPFKRYELDGHFSAIRLSDLLPQRALQRTRYHGLLLAPLGITDSLAVAIPSPASHSKHFRLDRHGGRFSHRDRMLLDHLQPHLGRLWRAAQTRRKLRAAISGLEWASEQDARGVLLLAADGSIEFASPPAHRLMRKYFGAPHKTELPVALTEWLGSDTPTFRLQLDDRCITVSRSGDALLLEEAHDQHGITPRERDILGLLTQGKTNSEIAEVLWIAPTTVGKHLENIYAKLGVNTRTAAVARFLGLMDAEAS